MSWFISTDRLSELTAGLQGPPGRPGRGYRGPPGQAGPRGPVGMTKHLDTCHYYSELQRTKFGIFTVAEKAPNSFMYKYLKFIEHMDTNMSLLSKWTTI